MADRTHRRVSIDLSGPGRVKQSFRDESDINKIMARWQKTGILPPGRSDTPMYGDFTNADDYMESLNKVTRAKEAFRKLPPKIRHRFNHDPRDLLAFMDDPDNTAEAIELGIIADPDAVESPEPEPAAEPDPAPE